MKSSKHHKERRQGILRFGICSVVSLATAFCAQTSPAAPMALHVSRGGDLYEFDVATGEYSLMLTFDVPVECGPHTRAGDIIFCADPEEFEGTWVRRLEASSANVSWQVVFPDFPSPDGIAFVDSLLYVVANTGQSRDFFLLTLDPGNGEELARVQLPEDLTRVYALAARGSELWLMTIGNFDGMAVRRLDPATGSLHESFLVPGVYSPSDADFGPDGRLYLSDWERNVINTAWCTDYWIVPFLGGTPDHQFSHCWEEPDPPPPTLAYFTLTEGSIVEVPTLGTAAVGVLVVLLALTGMLALRRRAGDVSVR